MTTRIGLTGSIGMGKSTTAQMFLEEGCSVWDADQAVHRLYEQGGAAVSPLKSLFPEAEEDGRISRPALKEIIRRDPSALHRIERIVHPLVAQDRAEFARNVSADILVFDIPLLFENGLEVEFDITVCVTVDAETQRRRVLDRGNMSQAEFETILANQMPDAQKQERADHVIPTDTVEGARAQVSDIVAQIRKTCGNA
ncbi:MAG: dephospho-CoA kinase [Pseudomonadota bacterium]